MYRAKTLVVLTNLLLTGLAHAQTAPDRSGERAIRELVQNYMNTRNDKDAARIRSLFTADADQLVSTGEWRRGIDALVAGAMASSKKELGKSSIKIESIRFVDPQVAIADGRYETYTASTGASRKMWTSIVVKHTNAGWRIAAIRNMLPSVRPLH